MIGCMQTRVRKQPIITLYFESENELKFYNLEACLKVIKLEFILKLKIKRNDWLLADTYPQAANHCGIF